MRSSVFYSTVLFSACAIAQGDHLNRDEAEVSRVEGDLEAYKTALAGNPDFQNAAAALYANLPPDVSASARADPAGIAEQIVAAVTPPAWEASIPASIVAALETYAAKPIKAAGDVTSYIEDLVNEPDVQAVLHELETAVPADVQASLASNSIAFLENLVTAEPAPAWVTKLPDSIQSEIGSVINHGLSLIAADFEAGSPATASAVPTGTPAAVVGGGGGEEVGNEAGTQASQTLLSNTNPTAAVIGQINDGQIQVLPPAVPGASAGAVANAAASAGTGAGAAAGSGAGAGAEAGAQASAAAAVSGPESSQPVVPESGGAAAVASAEASAAAAATGPEASQPVIPEGGGAAAGPSAAASAGATCPPAQTVTVTSTVTVSAFPVSSNPVSIGTAPIPSGTAPLPIPGTAPPGSAPPPGTGGLPPPSNPPYPIGSQGSTGSPIPTQAGASGPTSPISSFTGAAMPMRTGAVGAAALMAGAGFWLNY